MTCDLVNMCCLYSCCFAGSRPLMQGSEWCRVQPTCQRASWLCLLQQLAVAAAVAVVVVVVAFFCSDFLEFDVSVYGHPFSF